MQSVILAELVGSICEVYINDIIIYGATEEEFLSSLETVLIRRYEKKQ